MEHTITIRLTRSVIAALAIATAAAVVVAQLVAQQPSTDTGIIGYFNGTTCPPGWTEFTSARGRYIVGLLSGGTINTGVGTALTNQENRNGSASLSASTTPAIGTLAVGIGTLAVQAGGSGCTGGSGTVFQANDCNTNVTANHELTGAPSISGAPTAATTINGLSAVAGTTAPYLQLLVCAKS